MKVAVVGGGIVGATCAYYLKKEGVYAKVFDFGVGQATSASCGIICPWFSKRRNKIWYKTARLGADFYDKLVKDLERDNVLCDFYERCGVFLLKNNDEKLEELYELAKTRRVESELIGELKILSLEEAKEKIPSFTGVKRVLYASGGARVDGKKLVKTLLNSAQCEVVKKKVTLEIIDDNYYVLGEKFDAVILATGAWVSDILTPHGYEVLVRAQKGQLIDYEITDKNTKNYPVIMPEGELDIIAFGDGKISVGATHEDDKEYDLTIDDKLKSFEEDAKKFLPILKNAKVLGYRVGTRAYTQDYSAFFGEVPKLKNVFAISGLGSSGLTTGPIIAYNVVQNILGKNGELNAKDYKIENYIKK